MLKPAYFYSTNIAENTNKDLYLKTCHSLGFFIISVTSSLLLLTEGIRENLTVINNKCSFLFFFFHFHVQSNQNSFKPYIVTGIVCKTIHLIALAQKICSEDNELNNFDDSHLVISAINTKMNIMGKTKGKIRKN